MWRSPAMVLLVACILVVPAQREARASSTSSGYVLQSSVMGGGGSPTQGGGFRQTGTLSQPTPAGMSTIPSHALSSGFWRAWMPGTVIGVDDIPPLITTSKLFQNHPNPFRSTTSIGYTLAETAPVQITIYSITGQRVRQLVDEMQAPGPHWTRWDGTSDRGTPVAQGIYFYRLRTGTLSEVKKMILLD